MKGRPGIILVVLVSACGHAVNDPANSSPSAAFAVQCGPAECSFVNSSTDPDGRIESYAWNLGDGTALQSTRDVTHRYAGGGDYTVTLQVMDNDGASSEATASVHVIDPTEAAHPSFTTECSDLTCRFFNFSFAPDPVGVGASAQWDFGDGSLPVSVWHPTHVYAEPGVYTVGLRVADRYGRMGETSNTVDVTRLNDPPLPQYEVSCPALTCTFTDQSTDPDGTVVSHGWGFGDGESSYEQNPSHRFPESGFYDVSLTVSDNQGMASVTHRQVAVPDSLTPVPEFTVSCTGTECHFTDASTRGAFDYNYRVWSFGDGGTSPDANPTHVYAVTRPTTFTVSLTFTDDWLGGSSVSHDIEVKPE